MTDLSRKTVLVAGGAGYLGRPICRLLAARGAAVLIADRDAPRLGEAVAALRAELPDARIEGQPLDIADEASIRAAVDRAVARFGGLQAAVNATCHAIGKRVEDLSGAEFDQSNRVNITGAFLFSREAARVLPAGGSIVHFASMYGQVSPDPRVYEPPMNPNPIEYGAGKAAIIQMVKYLAVAWGPRGLRVNAVAPGPFPNPAIRANDPAFIERLAQKVPLGRVGRSDETAGAVAFLVSDDASYITGQTLAVNGGWTVW